MNELLTEIKDEVKDTISNLKIHCDIFGGMRHALACVHYDRYKSCRRNCVSLKMLLKENPDFAEKVKVYFLENSKGEVTLKSNQSGKNLPDPKLSCRFCPFVAKTERGLKSHLTRSHKKSSRI